jgi:hypothetical protein
LAHFGFSAKAGGLSVVSANATNAAAGIRGRAMEIMNKLLQKINVLRCLTRQRASSDD